MAAYIHTRKIPATKSSATNQGICAFVIGCLPNAVIAAAI
jgi:hypothetical protein